MKQFSKSIGTELLLLQNRTLIQSLESQRVIEAAALRSAEALRGIPTASGTNKIEVDLFTLFLTLITCSVITVLIVGVLVFFLPGVSPT